MREMPSRVGGGYRESTTGGQRKMTRAIEGATWERWARRHLRNQGLALRKSRTEDDAYHIYDPDGNTLVYPDGPRSWATLEQIVTEVTGMLDRQDKAELEAAEDGASQP